MNTDKTEVMRRVEIANEAVDEAAGRLTELRERQEVAMDALHDFALRAFIDGEDVEELIEIIGVEDAAEPPPHLQQMGARGMCKHELFASWLGEALSAKVLQRVHEQDPHDS